MRESSGNVSRALRPRLAKQPPAAPVNPDELRILNLALTQDWRELKRPDQLLRTHRSGDIDGWYVAGGSDARHIAIAHRLSRVAETAGINVSETLVPGAHNWQFAAAAFRAALPSVAPRLASQSAAQAQQEAQAAPYG